MSACSLTRTGALAVAVGSVIKSRLETSLAVAIRGPACWPLTQQSLPPSLGQSQEHDALVSDAWQEAMMLVCMHSARSAQAIDLIKLFILVSSVA